MAEKKTWEQASKTERVIGIVILIIIMLLVVSVVGGITSAIGSAISQKQEVETEQQAEPVTAHEEVQETEVIPFEKVTQDDPGLDVGTNKVTTEGVDGVRTKTFRITYVDGKETDRTLMKEEVTTPPISEVTAIGTREPYIPPPTPPEPEPELRTSNCNPNYSGCVPNASDVDCSGGSGNGPEYLRGTAQVIGSDVYGLDRDGNGVACE